MTKSRSTRTPKPKAPRQRKPPPRKGKAKPPPRKGKAKPPPKKSRSSDDDSDTDDDDAPPFRAKVFSHSRLGAHRILKLVLSFGMTFVSHTRRQTHADIYSCARIPTNRSKPSLPPEKVRPRVSGENHRVEMREIHQTYAMATLPTQFPTRACANGSWQKETGISPGGVGRVHVQI